MNNETMEHFDVPQAVHKMEEAGLNRETAETIVDTIACATGNAIGASVMKSEFKSVVDKHKLVTRDQLYRALWAHGIGIVAILTASSFLPVS